MDESSDRRGESWILPCGDSDFEGICRVINLAASAYKGVIPDDRWKEPYMSGEELRHEIDDGVQFWGFHTGDGLVGVMGIQDCGDVTLIRHAYVLPRCQGQGIGGRLLSRLLDMAGSPVLIGTWAAADWAIAFYSKHGFTAVSNEEKDRLLKKYWKIPGRQVETSVVLAKKC